MNILTPQVMYFVYGFYVLLFGTCIYMLRSHQDHTGERLNGNLYLSLTAILFIFCTVFVVDYTIATVHPNLIFFTAAKTGNYKPLVDFLMFDIENIATHAIEQLISVLVNVTAECMLIHRCYAIWSFRKRVVLPLIAASFITNALGIVCAITLIIGTTESNYAAFRVSQVTNGVYNICSAIVNGMLTLLTAGRIWWIRRQVRAHGTFSSDTFVQAVSKIILESGMIYPFFTVVALIVTNTSTPSILPFDFFPLTVLSAGIAPTLIIIRARLGKNVESLQDMISDFRFTSQESPREVTTRSRAQVYPVSMEPAETGGSEEQVINRKEAQDIAV
uniref:Uncharacterized protein n=1 Tax=Moniliophthora roreri TaxID=221103 RepID=A0A0W0EUV5_MONRR